MIAVAWLIAHTVIRSSWAIATVPIIFLKQELWSMHVCRIHLIIYTGAAQYVVDTLPLALIAIRALNTVFATRILRKINESMLIILLQTGTVGTVVKVACYQHLCIRR